MDESQPFKRLRFFTGQMLTAENLELEQQYVREKLKRHNRTLHGFGIVSGLRATIQCGQIIVEAGLALDCEGNELAIPRAQPIILPSSTDGTQTAYVCLVYVEEQTDYVPSATETEAASNENSSAASTITESVAVELTRENCNRGHRHLRARWLACGKSHPLTIAKLRNSGHGWRVERGYRPPIIK